VVDLQSAQAPTPATPAHGSQSALLASNTASPAGPPGADAESEEVAAPENAGGGSAASAAATMTAPKPSLATRVSGTLPEPAIATQLSGLSRIITQGATIQGVLETALNSDLPGYTRAVVSRDVRSFDGKAVLIPRGSRLIGQYRSAMSLGQSRVFVIWTRVIRPDGVSIQIVSPGGDALGRGGLSGDVDSHFFTRFGGSILLSVLNGGIAALAGTPSTQISIGSPAAAAGTAATALVQPSTDVMPTVKVKQGEAITIFVSRDLDFSAVRSLP
jgi:type IV secretory pathway VirB10-like protein